MKYLEIIAFNIESCVIAQSAGAKRIELCDNPSEGGTTPSYGFIKAAREKLQIDLFVMIRPRGGDFFYSDDEFEIMNTDIAICKQLGCDGIVIGLLKKDATIDIERTKTLVQLANPMQVTFHRAFDRAAAEPIKALEDVIATGCSRILTSGFVPNCLDGAPMIMQLIKQANDRIVIMPGSGLTSKNIIEVAKITGAKEFHASARMEKKIAFNFASKTINEELKNVIVNEVEVKKLVAC